MPLITPVLERGFADPDRSGHLFWKKRIPHKKQAEMNVLHEY